MGVNQWDDNPEAGTEEKGKDEGAGSLYQPMK